MTNQIQWYDALSACYGYRLQSEGERDAFYIEVNEVTRANNAEISSSIRWASRTGQQSSKQHGRVGSDDVIGWVFKARKRDSQRVDDQNEVERFKTEWIAKINAGYPVEVMKEEAFFIGELNEEQIKGVVDDIIERTK